MYRAPYLANSRREAVVAEGTGVAMARDKTNAVLEALARSKAMSLVELMSVVDFPDNEIEQIVESLRADNLVRVSGSGLDEIITIREQGLRAAG